MCAQTSVMPTYARADLAFERGEGAWLIAEDGERYLDFGSGVAVTCLGHAHPHLVAALKEQADKVWHTSNLYRVKEQERLAARLTEATFADTVFFANSGAEAVEGAIKTARKYFDAKGEPERFELITFEGAFHGRTLATIAAGAQPKHLQGFGPKAPGFVQVPFGDLAALEAAIGPATAGVLMEPVQGEGGIRSWSPEDLRKIRALCDKHGLLLVMDEVQTGVGRTGHLFAHQAAGIAPDIMAAAKGLGGGFPIGAVLATKEAAQGMTAGSHGSTFGGNPLACAVGNAVLDVVMADGFLEQVRALARDARQKLAGLVDTHPHVLEEVRGEGLMFGLKCRIPNTEVASAFVGEKLLCVGAGDNTVRLLPPLTLTQQEFDDAMARMKRALAPLEAKAGAADTPTAPTASV